MFLLKYFHRKHLLSVFLLSDKLLVVENEQERLSEPKFFMTEELNNVVGPILNKEQFVSTLERNCE